MISIVSPTLTQQHEATMHLKNETNEPESVYFHEGLFDYTEIKEEIQKRMRDARFPGTVLKYLKLMLYVEHRAEQEGLLV